MSRTRRGAPAVMAALAFALAVPSIAAAATKPGVTTLGAAKVTITTATLTGKVNPNGAPTTYFFQYGTNTAYGSRTPDAGVATGTAAVGATAAITGLGPNTKYHYRLVAHNSVGTTIGGDRTFTTPSSRSASPWRPRPTRSPSVLPRPSRARSRAPATVGARSGCSRSPSRSPPRSPTSATPSSRTPRAPSPSHCSRFR